jgi:hypothetical protein
MITAAMVSMEPGILMRGDEEETHNSYQSVVNLLPIDRINESEGARRPGSSVLCGGGKAREVLPDVESLPQLLTVFGGGEKVTSQAEVLRDGTIGGEEALGMPGGLEPLHAPLPLAGGLVAVFGAIVEIAMLAMFHPRQEFPLGGLVTVQFVGEDHPGDVLAPLQQRAEEFLRGLLVTLRLDQDVQHMPIVIHRPPEIMPPPPNDKKHFIQMPPVAGLRPPMPKLIRIGLADLAAPLPHRIIRHRDTAGRQEFFHIAITESEPVLEPHRVDNDLNWEAVIFIPIDGWCVHAPSMSHPVSARQAAQQVDKAQLGSHWIYRGRIASTDVKISSPFYCLLTGC